MCIIKSCKTCVYFQVSYIQTRGNKDFRNLKNYGKFPPKNETWFIINVASHTTQKLPKAKHNCRVVWHSTRVPSRNVTPKRRCIFGKLFPNYLDTLLDLAPRVFNRFLRRLNT